MNSADDSLAVIRSFSEAWARRDLNAVMAFFTEDCVYAASVGCEPGTTYQGRDEVRAGIAVMFEHDHGSTIETGRTFAFGDYVFAEWTYRFSDPAVPSAHGCDLFELAGGRIKRKEAFRKQFALTTTASTMPSRGRPETYRERRFDNLGVWHFGSKQFKVIGISHDINERPYDRSPAILDAAKAQVAELTEDMDRSGGHFDLGFVIIHEGEQAHWLLVDWWIEGGILGHILYRASREHPDRFVRESRPLMACVWEMRAITHERNAWIETMMTGTPSPIRYLANRMPAGVA